MSLIALTAKSIFTPLETIDSGVLLIEDGAIRAVGARAEISVPKEARVVELGNRILAPGFVDLHIHGGGGRDVMEASPEALDTIARMALQQGTTSFLPTTLSAPVATILKSLDGLGELIRARRANAPSGGAAELLGIHLEGPFLSAERRGVHPTEYLQKPSPALFEKFWEASDTTVKVLTLAPELEGAAELQALAQGNGVKVALGHSDATFDETERAIAAGASHAVHVFNAMRPFGHRECGIIGAILTNDRAAAEVIADGVHVAPAALRLLLRAKGAEHILLVTDATSATGMGAGKFKLGEMEIFVSEDPQTKSLACRNAEGKLAGSVLTQDRAVRNMAAFTGASLREAVKMASWNPARVLGIENRKGCLKPGADADVVVLEPNGKVVATMARGAADFID